MKVDVLLLLVNGNRIADAVPLQIETAGPDGYNFGDQTVHFEVPFTATDGWRVVYELPEGCYEMVLSTQGLTAGDTINLEFGSPGGTTLTACQRSRAFDQAKQVPSPHVV
jgi:hypothetical protein